MEKLKLLLLSFLLSISSVLSAQDFSFQNIIVQTDDIYAGDSLSFEVDIVLQGTSGFFFTGVDFKLSKDSVADFRDVYLASEYLMFEDTITQFSLSLKPNIPFDLESGEYYLIMVLDPLNELSETNENNNLYISSSIQVLEAAQDLEVTSFSISNNNLDANDTIQLDFEITNIGLSISEESTVRVKLSEDKIFNGLDEVLYEFGVDAHDPGYGQSYSVLYSPTFDLMPGKIYLEVSVMTEDSNNQNNRDTTHFDFTNSLDLLISDLTTFEDYITQAGSPEFTFNIQSNGTTPPSEVDVTFYLSADSVLSKNDFKIAESIFMPSYGASQTISFSKDLKSGSYVLIAVVDPENKIHENNEYNNQDYFFLVVDQADYDIKATEFTLGKDTISDGEDINISGKITNQGSLIYPSGSRYQIFFSKDSVFSGDDIRINPYKTIPTINPQDTVNIASFFFTSEREVSGTNYFLLVLDYFDNIEESDESNNVFPFEVYIKPSEVDITYENVTFDKPSIRPGEAISISGEVKNIGSQSSSSFPLSIYLSSDSLLSGDDQELSETFRGGLSPNTSHTFNQYINIPYSYLPGTYYVIVSTDIVDNTPADNTSAFSFTVNESEIDFEIAEYQISGLPSSVAGGVIAVQGEFKNAGNQDSGNTGYGFYLSQDQTLDNSDFLLKQVTIQDIPMQGFWPFHENILLPNQLNPGNYNLIVAIDNQFNTQELNDNSALDPSGGNNTAALTFEIKPQVKEILLDTMFVSESQIRAGDPFSIHSRLPDYQNIEVPSVKIEYFLSEGDTIDQSSIYLGATGILPLVNPFGPNTAPDTTIVNTSLLAPFYLTPGTYKLISRILSIDDETLVNNAYTLNIEIEESDIDVDLQFTTAKDTYSISEKVDIIHNLQNTGSQLAKGFYRFILSDDTIPDTRDRVLREFSYQLYPGEYEQDFYRYYIESDVSPGVYYIIMDGNYNQEFVDKNPFDNIFWKEIEITEKKPDLRFDEIGVFNNQIEAGDYIHVNKLIAFNQGQGVSAGASIRSYLSSDTTTINGIDITPSWGISVNELSPDSFNDLANLHIPTPDSINTGMYYLIFELDVLNKIDELDEANNLGYIPLWIEENNSVPGSTEQDTLDYEISSLTLASDTIRQGSYLDAFVTLSNTGQVTASFNRINFKITSDELGQNVISNLTNINFGNFPPPGQIRENSSSFPISLPVGTYYLYVNHTFNSPANVSDATPENNIKVKEFHVVPADIDLQMPFFQLGKLSARQSESMTVKGEIFNYGTDPVKEFNYSFYISTDTVFTTDDLRLISQNNANIGVGLGKSFTNTLTIPDSVEVGNYYILAVLDPYNLTSESNELNNTSYKSIRVDPAVPKIDFSLKGLSLNKNEATNGDFIDVYGTLVKNSNLSSGDVPVEFYLSEDGLLDSQDNKIGEATYYSSSSFNQNFYKGLQIPVNIDSGSYHILVQVDPENIINEIYEENNHESAGIIEIKNSGSYDLQINSISIFPQEIIINEFFELDLILQNSGAVRSQETTLSIYVSEDQTLDETDIPLWIFGDKGDFKDYPISGINPGRVQEFNFQSNLENSIISGPGNYLIAEIAEGVDTDISNNQFVKEIDIELPEIDLSIVEFVSLSDSVDVGETLSSRLKLTNNGSSNIYNDFRVDYYLSEDTLIDAQDFLLESKLVLNSIYSDQILDVLDQMGIPVDLSPGEYFLIVSTDVENFLVETNENNNIANYPITVREADIDLSLSNTEVITANPRSGSDISIQFTLNNTGTTQISGTSTVVYLSEDNLLDQSDIELGSFQRNFDGNSSISDSEIFQIPLIDPGNYHLIFLVDPGNTYPETNEQNNINTLSVSLDVPDVNFLWNFLSTEKTDLSPLESFTVTGTIKNTGSINPGNVTIHFYITDDTTATGDFLGDYELTSVGSNGAEKSFELSFSIPQNLQAGNYKIKGEIDPANTQPETNENDNIIYIDSIDVQPGFDLLSSSVSMTPNPVSIGNTSNLEVRIENPGVSATPVSKMAVLVSQNPTPIYPDDLLELIDIPSIDSSGEIVLSSEIQFDKLGENYVAVVADPDNELVEIDETNNYSEIIGIEVKNPQPDLIISFWDLDTLEQIAGSEINFNINLQNTGDTISENTSLRVVLSEDETYDDQDTFISEFSVSSMTSSATESFEGIIDLTDINEGTYHVIAFVDPTNLIEEKSEQNNQQTVRITVLSDQPRLTLEDLNVDKTNYFTDEMVELIYAVRNTGYMASSLANLQIFLSQDSAMNEEDILLKTIDLNPLNIGQVQTESVLLSLPNINSGEYFFYGSLENEVVFSEQVSITERVTDLLVAEFSYIDAEILAGNDLEVEYTLENIGETDLPETESSFFISTDNVWDQKDVLVNTKIAPPISSQMSFSESVFITLPDTLDGQYFLILSADHTSVVNEFNEDNNRLTGAPIQVTPLIADLSLVTSTIENAEDLFIGGEIQLALEIRNLGTKTSEPAQLHLLLKSEGITKITEILDLPELLSDESLNIDQSIVLSGDLQAGEYSLEIIIDPDNQLNELEKMNNSNLLTLQIQESALGIGNELQLKVYPNPAYDYFIIDGVKDEESITVQIYDSNGRRVLNTSTSREVDISLLKNGVYHVFIYHDTEVHKRRIIKH